MHEPARQKQNYKNIRKVLANGSLGDSGAAPEDPFEEVDVGRRFERLKEEMGHAGGSQGAQSSLVPPPRPTVNRKRDYNDYHTVGGKKVNVKERLTPTNGGRSKQIHMARSIEDEPRTMSYNTKVFN